MNDVRPWYKAIHARHSVRDFSGPPVEEKVVSRLRELCGGFSTICAGARGAVLTGTEGIFTGFGKVTGAPIAVAIIVDTNSAHPMVSAGYLGEGVVLEAVSARLGTCWVTHFNKPLVEERCGLASGEDVVAVIPVGTEANTSPHNPYQAWIARGIGMMIRASRKPVTELVDGLPREEWPPKLDYVFEAVRTSPSRNNRQPWRFTVEHDGVTLRVDKEGEPQDPFRHLEGGIAMLNFEVAAKACDIAGGWRLLDPPALAKFVYQA